MRVSLATLSLASALAAGCSSSSSSSPGPADAGASGDDAAADDATDSADASDEGTDAAADASFTDSTCTENGCVRELTKIATWGSDLLLAFAASGQTVDNGIDVYAIRYWSDGDEVTGSVYVPDTDAPGGGFPVVVMSQFTSGIGEPCAPSKGQLGIGVASATALRGMLTLVPDAASYGPPPVGLYLSGPTAGRAALDGARAIQNLDGAFGKGIRHSFVFGGLSQGAHSTMAAAAEYPTYASELDARGFVAVAPPANFRAGDNYVMSAGAGFGFYLAMRLYTWSHYYQLGPVFREPYASDAPGWFETDCEYFGVDGAPGTLPSRFPSDPAEIVSDEILAMGQDDSWSAGWLTAYEDAQPLPHDLGVPLAIFQGTNDVFVPKAGTDAYVEQLRSGGAEVDYHIVEQATHASTALSPFNFEQLASDDVFAWIQARFAE